MDKVEELLEKNRPSDIVSALLGELNDTVAFEEEGHKYSVKDEQGNSRILPSVTQILSPYAPDLSSIPADILRNKQQIGLAVHRRAENAESGEGDVLSPFEELEVELENEVNPALEGYCQAIDSYMADYESNPSVEYIKEVRLFNPHLMYAGAADCLSITDKTATLVDYKTVADRKSTRLNSSHSAKSRMPSSA